MNSSAGREVAVAEQRRPHEGLVRREGVDEEQIEGGGRDDRLDRRSRRSRTSPCCSPRSSMICSAPIARLSVPKPNQSSFAPVLRLAVSGRKAIMPSKARMPIGRLM